MTTSSKIISQGAKIALSTKVGPRGNPGNKGDKGDKGDPGGTLTKQAVESVLTGEISSHSHAGGSLTIQQVKEDTDIASAISLKHSNSLDHSHANLTTLNSVQEPLTTALKSSYDGAVTHAGSTHAPANAQKNSDITKAEIEDKLTGQIPSHTHASNNWGSGIATKNITDASTTQTIAHGLGRNPTFVRIDGAIIITAAITQMCTGIFSGAGNQGLSVCIGEGTSTAATDAVYTSTSIALGFSPLVATNPFTGANRQTGIISVDSTNITITWTKTGTVGSLTASLLWQCT